MYKILLRITGYLALAVTLSSCSSMSFTDIFSGYNKQMRPVYNAQLRGDYALAQSLIQPRSSSDGTYTLGLLETARLQYLNQHWPESEKTFTLASEQIQQAQQQAKIQLSRGVENVGAVVSNDNALRYDVPYYEQSMLHSFQALNYLYQQQYEGALVEVRRANLVQEQALMANQESLHDAQQKMTSNGINVDSFNKSYPSMATTIGKVKNGFQNAYTFYLSGILYEGAGQFNDAYIDYKRALEIYPSNQFLQQDVLRLAHGLSMTDDISRYEQRFGKYNNKANNNSGQLVLLLEDGIISPKDEISINLPIFSHHRDMRFYSVSLPVYHSNNRPRSPLTLKVNGQSYQSQEIVRLDALAAKHLKDQLPAMVVRQALRLVAKEEMRQQMSRKGGDVGHILASLYNIASENADTRSWSTLPDNVQLIRLNLSEGKHQITLQQNGRSKVVDVNITANRITLINTISTGSQLEQKITTL